MMTGLISDEACASKKLRSLSKAKLPRTCNVVVMQPIFTHCPATGGAVTSVRCQVAKISTVY
jgi:hypothetical protein